MKEFIVFIIFAINFTAFAAESCKTLKACSEWATNRTASQYELGKYEKRSIKFEKDFVLTEGDADFMFNYLLHANDLARIKRENGFQVIALKDLKDFQFPSIKESEIPATLDFYSTEFSLGNKEKVKNAVALIKKFKSTYGRVLEVAEGPKVVVIDTGIHLNIIKQIIEQLNK